MTLIDINSVDFVLIVLCVLWKINAAITCCECYQIDYLQFFYLLFLR